MKTTALINEKEEEEEVEKTLSDVLDINASITIITNCTHLSITISGVSNYQTKLD